MKTEYYNDWKSVVKSLIKFLVADGFVPFKANNGEDSITSDHRGRLAEKICECDEGNLFVRKGEFTARLFIVLGNSPEELVCDYGWKGGDCDELEESLARFSAYWEGKECPRKPRK